MKRKNYSRYVAAYGLSILIATLILQPTVQAAEVWSDNFDDGNFDEWTVHYGVLSAENYVLAANTSLNFQDYGEGVDVSDFDRISHSSSILTGTWSFDVSFNHTMAQGTSYVHGWGIVEIYFIANTTDTTVMSGMSISIHSRDSAWSFVLATLEGGVYTDSKIFAFGSGVYFELKWTHVEITRYSSGLVQAFINGTKRLELTDTEVESSEYLVYSSARSSAIDNVMVNDEPIPTETTPIETTTPTPTPTPTDTTTQQGIPPELLAIGIGVPVILVIVLVVWKVRK